MVQTPHKPQYGALEILKYIGPGLLVTVGFIDPGNWATNVAAGAQFGYALLWVISLSTIMLILLQRNAAHLGIATGLCLSEASTRYFRPWVSRSLLGSAMLVAVSTALAEILGGAIGLQMLFPAIPLPVGVILTTAFVLWMLLTNSYRRLESWIIGFVSIIGISFIVELAFLHNIAWGTVASSWVTPQLPHGAVPTIMALLGSVVMPHNLFLHSEVIQSRQWNLEDEKVIERQFRFEFLDTLFSMGIGWAINSAMIIVAAAVFFSRQIQVVDLQQAKMMLEPLVGPSAAIIFALALLMAGLASSVTAGMAGGSIFAGIFREPYDIHDQHSRHGVVITLGGAALAILLLVFLRVNVFSALIFSQIALSIQLPWTIFAQLALTSSKEVMGRHVNTPLERAGLYAIALIVSALNVMLVWVVSKP